MYIDRAEQTSNAFLARLVRMRLIKNEADGASTEPTLTNRGAGGDFRNQTLLRFTLKSVRVSKNRLIHRRSASDRAIVICSRRWFQGLCFE